MSVHALLVPTLVLLAVVVAVLVAIALVLRRRRSPPRPSVHVTPIAAEAGAAVRIEITNDGARPMHAPMVRLRPAPPAVRREHLLTVIPPSIDRTPLPRRSLAPGACESVDLPCPLQPGEVYTRVLGLAPDAAGDAIYGLPIETLLAIEIDWRTGRFPWPGRRHRAVLVRGEWCDAHHADGPDPPGR